jgi:serine/threonine-protein kinase HipA
MTRLGLLRWALFQYLIGNADAHGKNMSFFCNPAGLALAPCYDLVSVVQYEGLDHRPSAGNVDGRNGAGYGES